MIIITRSDVAANRRIGGGAFSDVYRISLHNDILVGNKPLNQIVVKIPKENKWKVDDILMKINGIRNSNLRTLDYAQKIILENKEALLLEDLNASEQIIFVSPNTKLIDHEKAELVHNLSQQILGATEPYVRVENSEAEVFRSECLLEEVLDFENDIDVFLEEIRNANVILFTDCFFFSSSKTSTTTRVNFKIADFDNIDLNKTLTKNLQDNNQQEFLSSYWEFVKKYFKESQKKEYYLKYLAKKM